ELVVAQGGEAIGLHGDASSAQDCSAVVAATLEHFGRIDVLVNNLGVRFSSNGVVDVTEDEWDRVMGVNVRGLVLMAQHAVPHMAAGSTIVNISSLVSTRPTYTSSVAYAASKGAMDALTISLAVQLADRGIRVNAVSPGNLWTPLAAQEVVRRKRYPDLATA